MTSKLISLSLSKLSEISNVAVKESNTFVNKALCPISNVKTLIQLFHFNTNFLQFQSSPPNGDRKRDNFRYDVNKLRINMILIFPASQLNHVS